VKTKITLLSIFLALIMTACSGFEEKATLTLYLGGGANGYSASALTNWPPQDISDWNSIKYKVNLSGRNEITEEVPGTERTINLTITPGDWIIVVEAYVVSDNELYARGVTGVTLRPGQNYVPIILKREGIYKLGIELSPEKIEILPGGNYIFEAIPSHGLGNKKEFIESFPNPYIWTVSGNNLKPGTDIDSAGHLTVSQSEEFPKTLTVRAAYVKDESIYGTATVTVKDVINAQMPNIITHPRQNVTYAVNTTETLSVIVEDPPSDNGILSYQWYSNTTNSNSGGTPIPGETGSSYQLPMGTAGMVGTTTYYYVEITNTNNNANGNKTAMKPSNVSEVTVTTLVNAQTPNIMTQPWQNVTYAVGETATLSVVVEDPPSDNGTLSYQWYSNTTDSNSGGTPIPGETGSSYQLPMGTAGMVGRTTYYYIEITNTNNNANGNKTAMKPSNTAKVTVTALVNAQTPNITGPICTITGSIATLTVDALITDGGSLSYEWYSSNTPFGNPPSGGTLEDTVDTIALSTLFIGTKYYYVVVTNTNTNVNGNTTAANTGTVDVTGTFVEVTGITGVVLTANVGEPFTLTGTVTPSNATNKTILWSVKNAGTTGASISGNTLNTTAAGTVKVTATITNGNFSSDYVEDFDIEVKPFAAEVTINAGTPQKFEDFQDAFDSIGVGQTATIKVLKDITLPGDNYSLTDGKIITLTCADDNYYTISLSSNGALFQILSTAKLIVTGNASTTLTLKGQTSINTHPLVYLNGGDFELEDGAIIEGNKTSGSSGVYGGGVYVGSGSTFTMNGGTIQDNETSTSASNHGAGVHVGNGSSFDMSGGTIKGNKTSSSSVNGGGVYVGSGSSFDMSGGTIRENIGGNGGGVYLNGSGTTFTFTMSNNATIEANTASSCGGGVFVAGGTFNMNDSAAIKGNTANGSYYASMPNNSMYGGGVAVNSGYFNMYDSATIEGNEVINSIHGGGGVCVVNGYFNMYGGTIYGSGDTSGDPNISCVTGNASLYMMTSPSTGTAKYGDGTTTIATPGNGIDVTLAGHL